MSDKKPPSVANARKRPNQTPFALGVAVLAIVLCGGAAGSAQTTPPESGGQFVGEVVFPVSCSEEVQPAFNRAVALLHHMTYPQARRAFEQIAESDPRCAMAHWGIAMTLFQPSWPTRPGPKELQRGWEAVQTAKVLDAPTERERMLIDAAGAFFNEPTSSDYWRRVRAWEAAMERAFTAYPDDPETAAFYALAHLATTPPGEVSLAHAERAAEILLGIYERNRNHPGAMHYLVHANDSPGRERESTEIVRRYQAIAPRNPHALHMPTHIFTRLGDWDAVIQGNLRAAEAALEHPAGSRGEFTSDEYPHAIEYLVYAYLQKGADEEAETQLSRLRTTDRLQPTFKTAFHLASIQARFALERRAWGEAAALVPRDPTTLDWDRFSWPEAVTWFARGLGSLHQGRIHSVEQASARLAELEASSNDQGEELFTRQIRVLRLELDAWRSHLQDDGEAGVRLMQAAAELEVSTPKHAVTPAPTLPAYELLGELLLQRNRAQEALAAFERSLALYPQRFNSLLGAARAARATGDDQGAGAFYQALLDSAEGSRRAVLEEARTAGPQ